MPVSSMWKLRNLDPLEADPAQISIAVRTDKSIGIADGGGRLELGFDANDDSVQIDESYVIEFAAEPAYAPNLNKDRGTNETVTVFRLSQNDARRMRDMQARITAFRQSGLEGTASFGVNLPGVCLHSQIPDGAVFVDIFMQTEIGGEFVLISRDVDLRAELDDSEFGMDDWPRCQEKTATATRS